MFVKTANNGSLNLRAEPNTSAQVLARVPYGTELTVEKFNDEWSKTTYQNKSGYVMNKFLVNRLDITKEDLEVIYDRLKATLKAIEEVLK